MAYKFQLGTAKLSGSVQLTDGQIASTDVDDTTAANIVTQIDAGEIPTAKLANDTISGITLGSNLNSLSKATNGGVNFSSYNGSAAVSDLALDLSDLAAAAVNVGADSIAIYDADADVTGKETIADLMTAVAGNGLAASSGVLAVGVDDSSIELNSDALRVKASGVTNAMLAGSIANGKLANSDVTIGSTAVALGATQTSFSGLTGLDFTAASAAIASSIGANNLTLGGSTSTVIIAGDLTVQGTTTTVDSTTINISSSFTFEGPADDYETTLNTVDATADRTVSLPNADGVLAILSPSLSDSELATVITAAPSELNLLDAGAGSSVGLEAGDSVIIFDNSDSDNGKKVLMSDIRSFAQGALSVASKADGNNLEADKVNYFADLSADATVTLPASSGLSAGQSVYIKAANLTSGATITINTQASAQKIDGADSIIFESPYAAVRLVYVAANDFRVF